jgi:hypothetical protein
MTNENEAEKFRAEVIAREPEATVLMETPIAPIDFAKARAAVLAKANAAATKRKAGDVIK